MKTSDRPGSKQDPTKPVKGLSPYITVRAAMGPALMLWWKGIPPGVWLTAVGLAIPIIVPSFVALPDTRRTGAYLLVACLVCGLLGMTIGMIIWDA